jgi:hypothetical protein
MELHINLVKTMPTYSSDCLKTLCITNEVPDGFNLQQTQTTLDMIFSVRYTKGRTHTLNITNPMKVSNINCELKH